MSANNCSPLHSAWSESRTKQEAKLSLG